MDEKKLLFIAYLYPPVGGKALPGVQRVVKFVRHLPNYKKFILTVRSKRYPKFFALDNSIKIPVNNEIIVRTGSNSIFEFLLKIRKNIKSATFFIRNLKIKHTAEKITEKRDREAAELSDDDSLAKRTKKTLVKDFISDIMTYPDYACGWILPALLVGREIIKKEKVDVIIATGMPWTSLLIGLGLKVMTGAKLIIDFRDPWAMNPFSSSKSKFVKKCDKKFEKILVEKADRIILNTPELKYDFINRYNYLEKNKFYALMNGYDPIDFEKIHITGHNKTEYLTVSHIGFLYGLRDPEPIFKAIQRVKEIKPELSSMIIFRQIGYTHLNYDVSNHVKRMGLGNNYIDMGPLTYNDALSYMESSDVLIIIQPETTTQIPSKIYEYIFFNKPIVSIGSSKGALANLIKNYQFGSIFNTDDIDKIAQYFIEKVEDKKCYRAIKINYEKRELFDIKNIIKQLIEIIDNVTIVPNRFSKEKTD